MILFSFVVTQYLFSFYILLAWKDFSLMVTPLFLRQAAGGKKVRDSLSLLFEHMLGRTSKCLSSWRKRNFRVEPGGSWRLSRSGQCVLSTQSLRKQRLCWWRGRTQKSSTVELSVGKAFCLLVECEKPGRNGNLWDDGFPRRKGYGQGSVGVL